MWLSALTPAQAAAVDALAARAAALDGADPLNEEARLPHVFEDGLRYIPSLDPTLSQITWPEPGTPWISDGILAADGFVTAWGWERDTSTEDNLSWYNCYYSTLLVEHRDAATGELLLAEPRRVVNPGTPWVTAPQDFEGRTYVGLATGSAPANGQVDGFYKAATVTFLYDLDGDEPTQPDDSGIKDKVDDTTDPDESHDPDGFEPEPGTPGTTTPWQAWVAALVAVLLAGVASLTGRRRRA